MKVQPIIDEDFEEQSLIIGGSGDTGHDDLNGWITDDGVMIYMIDKPVFHPLTGERFVDE